MTTRVEVTTSTGGHIDGVLCEPPGLDKMGALVVIHEAHGLNEVMKLHCERFAQAGFLALVPDLFHGKTAKNDDEIATLMATFDFQNAVGEIGQTVASPAISNRRARPRGARGVI